MSILFVSNLPPETTPAELERIFSRHGHVLNAQMAVHQKTGQLQNFGLVEMSEKDARWAQETLNRSWYKFSRIEVQFTQAPVRNQNRNSRQGSYHGYFPFKDREIHLVSGF
ncbi:hypothetical protein COW36_08830 [bacterium (Candidatus Blackallbacteria) CG17_big_fil_post_rev_8_21_14_2_50_48_46]|uniref:RRM domain-containing protein n=1 Tax=bacterium (Candidatus Blackallbacteria) CG17_big_fil_post_rev_8_21_14_2_50_48_46 TaxID=2014261 RepID=A0A2M7G6L6_9BACT|nr:MAG: hypothetical protein COW64_06130 [bacterium (Candidatus Blackallbacteria) CG18_big_fil_WC_8_21_14_2_50_49_26]PIW17589.1 MAG: hypothetical protein COW36_08830 [bacterium (Candidatus Blackallbacteria) CG17_big_fil_post_rev_8_21_14_2_50_48_46]PIW48444.1 MAG: hypothetical protein COW20_10180 [bacterium (Candidatus Blackallbacteria) CG13_big_fil_rev_8_21_14_2_50_49_14]